jgi:hypothetical protein
LEKIKRRNFTEENLTKIFQRKKIYPEKLISPQSFNDANAVRVSGVFRNLKENILVKKDEILLFINFGKNKKKNFRGRKFDKDISAK